jgi:hypothetical protein
MKFELRGFLAGLLCGGTLIATVWAGSVWWKFPAARSHEDAAIYDECLVAQAGNVVACDALMRMVDRVNLEKMLKEKGAQLLAAGFSKREVVDWAKEQGGVGRQLSDAVGMFLRELQEGKY